MIKCSKCNRVIKDYLELESNESKCIYCREQEILQDKSTCTESMTNGNGVIADHSLVGKF